MVSPIQSLPAEVVSLIAAGEVIDSPAAVVRELIDNALDAKATRIHIALWPEQWQIRVADNGQGMTLADLERAAAPHSTSKIHDRADLWQITSLGFRGEALHSLAQLADLEICSRSATAADRTGQQVTYNAEGEVIEVEAVPIAPGTIVTVSHLFQIWPTRRQSLPTFPQQMRAVQQVVQRAALCHPHVTWQVEQNDRTWFTLWPGQTAKQVLPQILKDIHPTDLQELAVNLHHSSDGSSLYLLAGLPDRCHRHRPDAMRVAVNGRCVRVPELEQVIFTAFRRTLPRDRHPICFIHLQVPAQEIDWNRHPAKAEVYLQHLEWWQEQVQGAIGQALSATTLPESLYSKRVGQVLKTAETEGGYEVTRTVQSSSKLPSPGNPLKAVAQVHQMYILAEHPAGLWLIEQHIAHERVLYEQLCDRWQLVALEPPIILQRLTPAQVAQLQRLQLTVEAFGEQCWAVRMAPEMLAQRSDCAEALLELSQGGDLETALVATACRSAIRNGTPLTLAEMQHLLDQWQQTRHPRTCPHGRPICLTLEESALSRFFRRHWVIGKSHGI
ncbi:DNA mismatch repair protein MutL [Leptolyngbya sp. 'hensonii']|uniref:DNA mismatch repair endonuclease MutL n=1 Tax=Leptolyngbya sp. 'hensonii' TaxID=1922337 RepID=UPI00094F764A|nr:DNA mismatch repair endonuclease MutL [Leptolyngbya sp. 'hensonii']OLP20318.1 DNA mismatch repair protein MutL [Leptolyngbya sp. 'hensonii']